MTSRQVDRSTNRAADGPAVPDYRGGVSPGGQSLVWDGVRMLLPLAIVLVLLGLGATLFRRWPVLGGRGGVTGGLTILARVALTAKDAICLVQVGAEVLVVGVSPSGIVVLSRLEAAAAGEAHSSAGPDALRGLSGARPLQVSLLRGLEARMREVQAAWSLRGVRRSGER